MSKDDRNTAIIVALVLVVCTISLVVIGGYLWRLISPGLNTSINSVNTLVRVSNTNYNFPVPKLSEAVVTPPAFQLPSGYTYNFIVPAGYSDNGDKVTGITDQAIVRDARNKGYGAANILTQADGFISIPNLSVSATIYTGNIGNELNSGFWEYPGNRQILLCQRQYFAVNDQRSCWDLDKLDNGNEIFVNRGGVVTRYVVSAIVTLTQVDVADYAGSANPQDIQLVTSTPLEGGQNRLIITATPQANFQ